MSHRYARPAPLHTLSESAELARQAVIAYAAANPQQIVNGRMKRMPLIEPRKALVTHHVPPWMPHDVDELVGAPALFAKAARAAGREVAAKRAGDAVCVAVRSPRIRAYWVAGRSSGVLLEDRKVTVAAAKAAL